MNDGGPAFPVPDSVMYGMTLRDYLAAKAMASTLIAQPTMPTAAVATVAYEVADEMLAAREVTK